MIEEVKKRRLAARGLLSDQPPGSLPIQGIPREREEEVIAVEAGQALVGAKPEITVRGLGDGADPILRKAIRLVPKSGRVLRRHLVRIESRHRTCTDREDGCEGNIATSSCARILLFARSIWKNMNGPQHWPYWAISLLRGL